MVSGQASTQAPFDKLIFILERMVKHMQEYTNEQPKQEKMEQLKKWLQDNLRIIVSIVIVAIIAGGIYSYSKRVESPAVTEEAATTEQNQENEGSVEVADKGDQAKVEEQKEQVEQKVSSQETESAFIETAIKGDGTTHLARRALANYLEKNPDSTLTKEHKIYIEDYLRKNVDFEGRVFVGTQVEFSKDLIKQSIEKSKGLNEKQLENLKQFSARVTTL